MIAHRPLRALPALAALLLLLLLALLVPRDAHGHGALRRSVPAKGAHLSAAPREVRLTFNERVELSVARVSLVGPGGAEVALGPLALDADSATVVVAPLAAPLREPGEYTLRWQVASADGHPVRGSFTFEVAPGAEGLAPQGPPAAAAPSAAPAAAPAPSATPHRASDFPEGPGFDAGSWPYVAVRWLTFAGLLGVVGAVAFRLGVLPRAAAGEAFRAGAEGAAARLGLLFAALLAVAAVLRLGAQSYAMHGGEGVLDAERVGAMVARTRWGWGWLLQAAGTALAALGFAAARRAGGAGWGMAGAGAVLLAVGAGLSGHAAAAAGLGPLPVAADAAHVLGAGGWLGALLFVLAAGIPAAARSGERARGTAALVNAYSPVALACAAVVTATGVFAGALHLGGLAALWESGYGRTLLLKTGLLAAVFALGAYNWRRVRPALGEEAAVERLRRSAGAELAVGALVLLATAVLVATATPGEG